MSIFIQTLELSDCVINRKVVQYSVPHSQFELQRKLKGGFVRPLDKSKIDYPQPALRYLPTKIVDIPKKVNFAVDLIVFVTGMGEFKVNTCFTSIECNILSFSLSTQVRPMGIVIFRSLMILARRLFVCGAIWLVISSCPVITW